MDGFITMWNILIEFTSILFYISIVAILLLIEKYFIRKRSKGEWIFPMVMLAAAFALTIYIFPSQHSMSSGLQSVQVFKGNQEVGHIPVVFDGERNLKAFGQYITREGADTEFIDLELKDGRLVHTSKPLDCEEEIEEVLSYYKNKADGSSQLYEDLIPLGEENEFLETSLSPWTFLYGGVWFGIPVLLLFAQWLNARRRRRKKNYYNKMKLKDL